jgi:ABC-type uncharacterized transport system permease subunit
MIAPDLTVLLLQAAVVIVLIAAALTRPSSFLVAVGALAGAIAALAVDLMAGGWRGDLAPTLWASLTATLLAYVTIGWRSQTMQRLTGLLMPYLVLLGILSLVVRSLSVPPPLTTADLPILWFDTHIVIALATYALLSLAAIAGLACLLEERALKRRAGGGHEGRLPPVADSERVEVRLLGMAWIVLGIGIATGMALGWIDARNAIPFDHKTVLAVAAFVVIGVLLWLRARTGFRGRRAARWVLVAWLLLTLAYPGVKFVREFLIG